MSTLLEPTHRMAPDSVRQRSVAHLAWTVSGFGVSLAVAGALFDALALILVGGATVGAVAVWAMAVEPAWFLLGFVAIRPVFDLGPTYGRGPNLNEVIGLLLLGALASWTWQHRARLVRPHASIVAAAAFAGTAFLSAMGSDDPRQSVLQAVRLASIVGMFFVGDQIARRDSRFLWRTAVAVTISALVAAVPAILQIVGALPTPNPDRLDLTGVLIRPPGPYPAPTVLATHVALGIALLVVFLARGWQRHSTRVFAPHFVVVLGVLGWVMVENKSRSALGALLLALAVFAVWRWKWMGLAATLMVGLLAGATLQSSTVRLNELGTGVDVGASADTLQWRLDYWRDNLPRFEESPITGIGLGRVEQLHEFRLPPHSMIVQTVVELGLAGSVALVAFFVLMARDLARALVRARRTPHADLVLMTALLCLGYGIQGLSENLLAQVVTGGPLAMLVGAALGMSAASARVASSPDTA